jgi:hypothetical protein
MKKLILILFIPVLSFGQVPKIEVNSSGLFINSNKITKQTDASFIESILGKPDKKLLEKNTIWIYDELGMKVWLDPETEKNIQFDMLFNIDDALGTKTKKPFVGEVLLHDFYISENSPWNSIKKIPELQIDDTSVPPILYFTKNNNLNLTFNYNKDSGILYQLNLWGIDDSSDLINDDQEEDTENTNQSYLAYVKQAANFRRGPGTQFNIIKPLTVGTQIFVISTIDKNNYYNVIDLETNTEGYIYKTYVQLDRVIEINEDNLFVESGKSSSSTLSDVEVYNNTNKVLTVFIGGNSFVFSAQEKRKINIKPAQYDYRVTAPGVLPYLGKDKIVSGFNYSWEFYIVTK